MRPHDKLHPITQSIREKLKEGLKARFFDRYCSESRDYSADIWCRPHPVRHDLMYLNTGVLTEGVLSAAEIIRVVDLKIKGTALYIAKEREK